MLIEIFENENKIEKTKKMKKNCIEIWQTHSRDYIEFIETITHDFENHFNSNFDRVSKSILMYL